MPSQPFAGLAAARKGVIETHGGPAVRAVQRAQVEGGVAVGLPVRPLFTIDLNVLMNGM